MTKTVIYSALILSMIAYLIALAIATAYVRDKPATPMPVTAGKLPPTERERVR